jgi:hypothetical protein
VSCRQNKSNSQVEIEITEVVIAAAVQELLLLVRVFHQTLTLIEARLGGLLVVHAAHIFDDDLVQRIDQCGAVDASSNTGQRSIAQFGFVLTRDIVETLGRRCSMAAQARTDMT